MVRLGTTATKITGGTDVLTSDIEGVQVCY